MPPSAFFTDIITLFSQPLRKFYIGRPSFNFPVSHFVLFLILLWTATELSQFLIVLQEIYSSLPRLNLFLLVLVKILYSPSQAFFSVPYAKEFPYMIRESILTPL